MKKHLLPLFLFACVCAHAQDATVSSPDGLLQVNLFFPAQQQASYTVTYAGNVMLENSPLGLETNIGDFGKSLTLTQATQTPVTKEYTLNRSKQSKVNYTGNLLECKVETPDGHKMQIEFKVSNNDVAFRYFIPKQGETASIRVMQEYTGFHFPEQTTTFLTPQSDAMVGWKRTKPSYEEEYKWDAPMNTPSQFGHGYTFPGLFHVAENGWVLVSETGVSSRYCGSRLSDCKDNTYTIAYPMPEENNGNGSVEPAFSLPGSTPWRTLTVGNSLKPIVETTIPWDVVDPLYETKNDYKFGRGTWSWILWQDNSINISDLKKYADLAAAMKYEYILVDNWWDTNIGREGIIEVVDYAHSLGIDVFMWYSSSGYWNDIEQGPINCMDNSIIRKKEMQWLHSIGVKGIKVDFFGGDKQETMRLYEQILSDADDNELMVIFHGCTLPRGWERMYPNYVGSEAVLASENMYFGQHACDMEAKNATTHPFIRNTVGCMEFGGTFLSRRIHKNPEKGSVRRTTDMFELATSILFQNPIQNFALQPRDLTDAPQLCIDFMKSVPTTWDEVKFIDGYPGKYIVLARRHGRTWYVAAINATDEPLKLKLNLPMLAGYNVQIYDGGNNPTLQQTRIRENKPYNLTLQPQDGVVFIK